ncbi:MAG: RAMP superfamily CRISPR-associated protein [Anaerolineae bacterium]
MAVIDVTLTFQTPLNVGSGAQQGTLADRAMIKDQRGWPYVPASALKGRLRHAVEQVAAGLGISVCVTHQKMCPIDGKYCPVCCIFGSPWRPGQLRFTRLNLVAPDWLIERLEKNPRVPPRTTLRYGVALSRRRGVAEDALLYTTELFEPGIELAFRGQLVGDLTPPEVALVLAGLKSMPALGRGKSGGLGWLRVEAQVSGVTSLDTPAAVRAALETLRSSGGENVPREAAA